MCPGWNPHLNTLKGSTDSGKTPIQWESLSQTNTKITMVQTFNKSHKRETECSGIWRREGSYVFRAWQGNVSLENGLSANEDWGGSWRTCQRRKFLISSDTVKGIPLCIEKVIGLTIPRVFLWIISVNQNSGYYFGSINCKLVNLQIHTFLQQPLSQDPEEEKIQNKTLDTYVVIENQEK